jgi:hypothetical protein
MRLVLAFVVLGSLMAAATPAPAQDAVACQRCRQFCYHNPMFRLCSRPPGVFGPACERDIPRINACFRGCMRRACRGF